MRRRTVRHSTRRAGVLALLVAVITPPVVSAQAKARAAAPRADQYQVPAGTIVSLRLRTPIGSGSSQPDDQVDAVLSEAVTQDGVELIPAGSLIQGTVVTVDPASRQAPLGRITFAFAVVQHSESGSRAPFRTRTITIDAVRPAPPVGKRAKSQNAPLDVSLPAGHPFWATLAEPLIVAIPKSRS